MEDHVQAAAMQDHESSTSELVYSWKQLDIRFTIEELLGDIEHGDQKGATAQDNPTDQHDLLHGETSEDQVGHGGQQLEQHE